ncbi:MAG: TIGR04290 family methyltransferase [Geminicoccaceae bacterium]|jgi:tRNA (mo5U34)-methyltransferase|nr:TIGR04290 family methyltransferase [Geminicoccaceae bacterium]MCB9969287.1 TIGR04290 family methyltransferase [Geminicoccaceae bacterium]
MADLADAIARLAPWFHNLHLPGGVETAPDHFLGDFPRFKWREIAPHLPADLAGARVLDIGCNAGFYSFALAARGADVLGIDVDEHYLAQARWAKAYLGADRVAFRRASIWEVDRLGRFDLVLFMGVLYHLRHPLLALDLLASTAPGLLVFQTLTHGGEGVAADAGADQGFTSRHRLEDPGWPRMAFIETTFAGDPTNWWIPNHAAVAAMLRSAGFTVEARPAHEVYICRCGKPAADPDLEAAHRAAVRLEARTDS